MITLIIQWLKNKDYTIGVEIYRRYGKSSYLLKLFEQGYDSYNARKLTEELQDLLTATEAHLESAEKPRVLDILATGKASELDTAPEEIKTAIRRRKFLYARAKSNFAKLQELYLAGSEQVDLHNDLNQENLNAWDEIKELWDLTNFYDRHRRLPTQSKNIELTQLDSELLNKQYISDYKYIKKYRSDLTKKEQVLERIDQSAHIKKLLISRDAFYNSGLQIPTPDEFNSQLSL